MSPISVAAADLRGDRLVVYSSSQTRDGFWITNGEFELLAPASSDQELGAAVLRMLDASRSQVRTPNLRGPSPFSPVLEALGLRSWSAYARGLLHVHIEREGRSVKVAPSRNGGSREGLVGIVEDTVLLSDPSAESLGSAVRAAFADCS
ncbi:hypothetical protein [Sinomonas halotolerans]|uniref:DUF1854 domain-containing protein n=1 Tax=Sinomonas halotolerans TaxID=1644133 RepID=A0ABU9WXE7_9MICC